MRNKFLEELKPAAFRKKKQASSFFFSQFALSLQTQKRGVMLEWLKRHAWKACIRQKRIASSNLAHSAQQNPIKRSEYKTADLQTERSKSAVFHFI